MRYITLLVVALFLALPTQAQTLKGCKLSANKFDPNSTSNPYGRCGSPYSPDSIHNKFGKFGSPYSPYSINNPYATKAPKIVAPDGTYLGRFSKNKFDPDSTSNDLGVYGNPLSPDSINNDLGTYGNPLSPESVTNPYATDAPYLVDGDLDSK